MPLWALTAVKFHLLSPLPSGARFRLSHKHNGKGYFWRMVGRLMMSMLRAGDLFLCLICVSLTLWSPLCELSGSYWEDNKSSEMWQELGTTKPQWALHGEPSQRICNLKLSQFIQETGPGPRPSAEHQKEILSNCRDFATPKSGTAQLSRGQRQMVFKWVNSRLC